MRDIRALEWLVGGSSAAGTISQTGVFTAPSATPTGGKVTISARVLGAPTVSRGFDLRILPPQSYPHGTVVLASRGGTATAVSI